jgi:hypothetical protein
MSATPAHPALVAEHHRPSHHPPSRNNRERGGMSSGQKERTIKDLIVTPDTASTGGGLDCHASDPNRRRGYGRTIIAARTRQLSDSRKSVVAARRRGSNRRIFRRRLIGLVDRICSRELWSIDHTQYSRRSRPDVFAVRRSCPFAMVGALRPPTPKRPPGRRSVSGESAT